MLFERIDSFIRRLQRFYDFKIDDGKILIDDLYRAYVLLIRFIQHVILDSEVAENEVNIKSEIAIGFNRGDRNFFDIFHCSTKVVECFKTFCEKYKHVEKVGFAPDLMFKVIPKYQIESFVDVAELQQRRVEYFEPVWLYDYFELRKLNSDELMVEIDGICEKWFSELPSIYNSFYNTLFEKSKYRFNRKFEYCNKYVSNGCYGSKFSSIVREYDSNSFSVVHNPECSESFSDEDKENGLLYIHSSLLIERFLQRKRLFYDAVRCLLYQGICRELGYETSGGRL